LIVPIVIILVLGAVAFAIAGPFWELQREWLQKTSPRRPSEKSLRSFRVLYVIVGIGVIAMGIVVIVLAVHFETPLL
jgi:hypothetical protein